MDPITLSAANVARRRAEVADNPGNVATRIPVGRMGTLDASTAKTFQATFETADDFDAIRLVFANNNPSYSPIVTACAASVPASAADVNNSTGAWVSGTRQGQAGFAIQTAQQGTDLATFTVSDWINLSSVARTDSGTHPLVTVRVRMIANASLPVMGDGTDDFTNWAGRSDGGRSFWWRQQDGDALTDPTTFTSTTNVSQAPIAGIQYLCRGQVITVGAVGDSITEGRGTHLGEGFVLPAVEALNVLDGPTRYEYACFGWSGQPYDRIAARGLIVANSDVKPDILVIAAGTPNPTADGALTDAAVSAIRTRRAALVTACRAAQIAPILWTWLPTNTSVRDYAGTDPKRVAYNTEVMGQTSRNVLVADLAVVVSGDTVSGQVQYVAGDTTDGIHPNDTGNAALSAALQPVIVDAGRRANGGTRTSARRADAPVFMITDSSASGTPLLLGQAGTYIYAKSNGTFWNLPPLQPGVAPDSQVYTVHVRSSSLSVIVNRSGTDAIHVGGAARASITIKPGQSATFVPGLGTQWDVIGLDYPVFQAISTSALTTLSLDMTASTWVFTGTATATWSLPSIPTSGLTYTVRNRGSAVVNLYGVGTGKVYTTAVADFVAVAAGAAVTVVWDGTYWVTV